MLTYYYYFIHYRLDLVLTLLLSLGGCIIAQKFIGRRSRRNQSLPFTTQLVAAALVLVGCLVAELMGREQSDKLTHLFSGFGPTYAQELAAKGHEYITLETPADDPRYLELIETEKRWLNVNPVIADIYTYRRDSKGLIRLIVDSETDYDHNSRFEGEREERTAIGEIYLEATPKFFKALEGTPQFESTLMPDRWGIWVSCFYPIYNRSGHVEAAVGIDYPADSWLNLVGTIRMVCLIVTLMVVVLLLTSSGLVTLMSEEIRERKAALLRMEQARESAIESSSAKSEFLAVTSHEVRTPLTAILGFATMLSDTPLDPTQRRYLDTMNHAGERLMELLNGILDYTRIETGKLELERLPWSPAMLVHEVIQSLSSRVVQNGVALNFDNNLPGNLTLTGDATRIRQILLNLMANALKFTSQGSVTVQADWAPDSAKVDQGKIILTVIDTGIGIPADRIPHLFKAFSQVDASTTRTHGGSGLGLAISKRLADMMGGSLTVKSVRGQGSQFTLALECPVSPPLAVSPVRKNSGSIIPTTYNGRGLVVDDQRLNRELLKVMLRRCGMETDLAASGPEAVDLAARNSYLIIFTDLEMPEMDGFTAAERIRAAESPGRRIPIVAISALTAKGTRERCLAAGMDDYLTKPIYLPALQSTLTALLPQVPSR